eukprot:9680125-Lingulodinium_polyedra.AAC.1
MGRVRLLCDRLTQERDPGHVGLVEGQAAAAVEAATWCHGGHGGPGNGVGSADHGLVLPDARAGVLQRGQAGRRA